MDLAFENGFHDSIEGFSATMEAAKLSAFAVVTTGVNSSVHPGVVLARIASKHIRVG